MKKKQTNKRSQPIRLITVVFIEIFLFKAIGLKDYPAFNFLFPPSDLLRALANVAGFIGWGTAASFFEDDAVITYCIKFAEMIDAIFCAI